MNNKSGTLAVRAIVLGVLAATLGLGCSEKTAPADGKGAGALSAAPAGAAGPAPTSGHCDRIENKGTCEEYPAGVYQHASLAAYTTACKSLDNGTFKAGPCPITPNLFGSCKHPGGIVNRFYVGAALQPSAAVTEKTACTYESGAEWTGK